MKSRIHVVIKQIREVLIMVLAAVTLGKIAQWGFFATVIMWSLIIGVFIVIRIRTAIQRHKYANKKQEGDVSTRYTSNGLH
jgi:Na+/melibiose symporter-like transporter